MIAGTLHSRARGQAVDLLDVSCGVCEQCRAGVDFWCTDPQETAGVVLAELEGQPEQETVTTLLGLSALAGRPSARPPVLIESSDPSAAERLAGLLLPVAALATSDSRSPEARERLAAVSATGRAAVIVNGRDQAKAVRAVERGGVVVFTSSEPPQATLTEIVQRELTIIGVDSLAPLRRAGVERLSAALAGSASA